MKANLTDSVLENPAQPGSFSINEVVYASSGLDYSTNPNLGEYQIYQNPTSSFETQRLNLDDIATLGVNVIEVGGVRQEVPVGWPFRVSEVPINGHIRIPNGNGPFPLIVFAHGNHGPLENSTPGYLYLCDLLASHGIIAATIDVNFLNGSNRGENDARAIVHLEHIKQFLKWNSQESHPLQGKIDGSKIAIVGHSRGGEAVGHASLFNSLSVVQFDPTSPPIPLDGSQGLGPYGFKIQAIIALAPTDNQYEPVSGPTKVVDNFFLIHGSRDEDVWPFPGYKTYDRSHGVNLSNPSQPASGFKSLLWIHGANHNFFNAIWQNESDRTLVSRVQQEQIAKVFIAALSLAVLNDQAEYLELLKNHAFGVEAGWLPDGINYVSQFQDPSRLFIQHFEEDGNSIDVSQPVKGSVKISAINVSKLSFRKSAISPLFQETQGLQLIWDSNAARYSIDLEKDPFNLSNYSFISFRVGQSSESNNPRGLEQNFKIEIRDDTNVVTLDANSINQLLYPDPVFFPGQNNPPIPPQLVDRVVMQTFRISLSDLESRGIKVAQLQKVSLLFNVTDTGTLYFDELQLTN